MTRSLSRSSDLRPPTSDLVVVVGGGPAGSATATLLAEAGHRVLLFDKARFPRHKACSEYVNPAGVGLLERLGVAGAARARGAHRLEGMLVHAPGGGRFLADFAAAGPGRAALGLSRHELDLLLLRRAAAAGVEVVEGAHVRGVLVEAGRVVGVEATIDGGREEVRAALTIGADGRHSVVARALGLAVPLRWPRRTGLVAHYRGVGGWAGAGWGEMHVAPRGRGYAGLAPLEDGLTNVAFVADSAAVGSRPGSLEAFFEAGLAAMPEVARKLAGAERVGTIRGVGPMAQRAGRTAGDGFLLVGDAASFLDPFTGEGVYEALRAAFLAAPVASAALSAGDTSGRALAPYVAARRRAFWAKRQVCWMVQGFIGTPVLLDYIAPRLQGRAEVGRTLTGVLGGFHPAQAALSPRFLARLLRP